MEALEGASMQQDLGFPAPLNASAKGMSRIPHVQKGRPKLHRADGLSDVQKGRPKLHIGSIF